MKIVPQVFATVCCSHTFQVVQLYLEWVEPPLPVPRLQLAGYHRLHLQTGTDAAVEFVIHSQQMAIWVDKATGYKVFPGKK